MQTEIHCTGLLEWARHQNGTADYLQSSEIN